MIDRPRDRLFLITLAALALLAGEILLVHWLT